MELKDFSRVQLARMYDRLHAQIGFGGMFGWDWVTLRMTYPSVWLVMRSVAWEHDQKLKQETKGIAG